MPAGPGPSSDGSARDAGAEAPTLPDAGPSRPVPDAAPPRDAAGDGNSGEVVSGTPDGGAYSRAGWTATSNPLPIKPPGPGAQGSENLDPINAIDGKVGTRWSLGDLHHTGAGAGPTSQKIGDQFTLDMQQRHTFSKLLFWAGGPNGRGGPDARDYPGAVDATLSDDCTTFGPVAASGTEPQPGCQNDGKPCDMPFTITFPAGTTARCVRMTLTKVLKLGGGIWWAIDELYVYP